MELDEIVSALARILDEVEKQYNNYLPNDNSYSITRSQFDGLDNIYTELLKKQKVENAT